MHLLHDVGNGCINSVLVDLFKSTGMQLFDGDFCFKFEANTLCGSNHFTQLGYVFGALLQFKYPTIFSTAFLAIDRLGIVI